MKMRREDKQIKDQSEIDQILHAAQEGRLGLISQGQPYIVPMNFVYSDGKIILHSARDGRKIAAIQESPRVCFEVEDSVRVVPSETSCQWTTSYRCVLCFGTARFLQDPSEKRAALKKLVAKYAGEEISVSPRAVSATAVIEITVEEFSGKKSGV